MSSKTALRMTTVFLAMLFVGMFFRGEAKATVSTDAPENFFKFDEPVLIGSPDTETLGIKNENGTSMTLFFNLMSGGSCGFSYDLTQQEKELEADQTAYLQVKFDPSGVGSCTGTLRIYYLAENDFGWVDVTLNATGVDEILPSTIMVGSLDTGIQDQPYNGQLISQLISGCATNAKNQGQFVSCVSELTNELKKDGIITGAEKGVIQSAAAESNVAQ